MNIEPQPVYLNPVVSGESLNEEIIYRCQCVYWITLSLLSFARCSCQLRQQCKRGHAAYTADNLLLLFCLIEPVTVVDSSCFSLSMISFQAKSRKAGWRRRVEATQWVFQGECTAVSLYTAILRVFFLFDRCSFLQKCLRVALILLETSINVWLWCVRPSSNYPTFQSTYTHTAYWTHACLGTSQSSQYSVLAWPVIISWHHFLDYWVFFFKTCASLFDSSVRENTWHCIVLQPGADQWILLCVWATIIS